MPHLKKSSSFLCRRARCKKIALGLGYSVDTRDLGCDWTIGVFKDTWEKIGTLSGIRYFLSISILIFPFTFLGQNPSDQLFLCILRFIYPLKQLKALLITYHHHQVGFKISVTPGLREPCTAVCAIGLWFHPKTGNFPSAVSKSFLLSFCSVFNFTKS